MRGHCEWCETTHHLGLCLQARLMRQRHLERFIRAHRRRARGEGFHAQIAMPCDACTIPTRADLLSPRAWCAGCEREFRRIFRSAA